MVVPLREILRKDTLAIISSIVHEGPFYCHIDVENRHGYEEEGWEVWADENAKQCAGAMIFANNICKLSRDPIKGAAQKKLGKDKEKIFATPQEFIDHHSVTINGKIVGSCSVGNSPRR